MSREAPILFRHAYLTISPGEQVPTAAEPPPVVVGRDARLGHDFLDFDELEEDLRVEDLVPDLDVPTGGKAEALSEFRAVVRTALAALPRTWRHVLELRFADDLGFSEVSRRTGVPEDEILAVVEHARALLRAHLEESGCRFIS